MESKPDTTGRLRSLEVDRISELFDRDGFPMTTDEVVEQYGDVEVQYPGGSFESLEEILATSSGNERYDSTDDLQLTVLTGVQRDAVGRPRYSDRDPPVVGEERKPRQSF